jgi:hypothetical protein
MSIRLHQLLTERRILKQIVHFASEFAWAMGIKTARFV